MIRNIAACGLVMGALACTQALAQQPVLSGDVKRAEGKISMCVGCHGIPSYRTAFPEVYSVPLIAGQAPDFIVNALKAYKSGERNHPSMVGIARSLNDQDMADLAAYYSAANPAAAKK